VRGATAVSGSEKPVFPTPGWGLRRRETEKTAVLRLSVSTGAELSQVSLSQVGERPVPAGGTIAQVLPDALEVTHRGPSTCSAAVRSSSASSCARSGLHDIVTVAPLRETVTSTTFLSLPS